MIKPTRKYQRDYRQQIVRQLKQRLGFYCHGHESPDAFEVQAKPLQWLELVILDRQAPDLEKYGHNTISIYNAILKNRIPLDRVTLLCPECKFEKRQESKNV